jgi:hypothetical protein
MARTSLLLEAYPYSTFVFIHRNPFQCIQSTQRIWNLNRSFSFETYTDQEATNLISKQYELFYHQYGETLKPAINSGVRFSDLVAQPLKTIEKIYADLSLHNLETSTKEIKMIIKKRTKTSGKYAQPNELEISNFSQIKNIHDELGYH